MALHSQNKMNRTIYILIISILAFLCLHSCAVDIDPKIANTAFGLTAIKYEYIIMILSLCSGIFCIIEGTDFTSKLINASPGVLLMVIGALIIIFKRLKIRSKQIEKPVTQFSRKRDCWLFYQTINQ